MKSSKRHRIAWSVFLLVATGLGIGNASAAQQEWASQYVHWTSDGMVTEIFNIDQVVWLPKPNKFSFWPLQWTFSGSGDGGYVGLQEATSAQDQNVRFSIWNATLAKGPNCRPFGGEGIGYTCEIHVAISTKKFYRLRLSRLTGNWWGAWIINTDATGALRQRLIGKILAPVATGPDPTSLSNFAEYWGQSQLACQYVPLSIIGFAPPMLNYVGFGVYEGRYTYGGSTKAPGNLCSTGVESNGAIITTRVRDFGFAPGALMFLGATAFEHRLSRVRHPLPPLLPDS